MKKLSVVLALAICLYSHASAQEWTRFRGPNGQGHSSAKNVPVKWTPKDYLWTADLPGAGHITKMRSLSTAGVEAA